MQYEKMEWPARLHETRMRLRICSVGHVFWVGNIYWQIENERSALLRACVWIGSTNETCFLVPKLAVTFRFKIVQ